MFLLGDKVPGHKGPITILCGKCLMKAYAKGNGSLETQVGNPAPGKDLQRREEGQQGLRAKK